MICHACKKEFNYTPSEYGGSSIDLNGNLCKGCWDELIEMTNRHLREIQEWVKSKVATK